MRLNSRAFLESAAERGAAHQARLARGRDRRPDRADRRAGRSARRRDRRRQRHAGGVALRRAAAVCSATGSTSSCSATASRASASPSRCCVDMAYAKRHPAGRRQRAVFRDPRGLRGARRADLRSPRAGWSPTPTAASSPPSTASRPAPRWRRCSPTCRRRWTTPSRSPNAALSS